MFVGKGRGTCPALLLRAWGMLSIQSMDLNPNSVQGPCFPQLPCHSTNPSPLLHCTGILCKGLQQKSWLKWSSKEDSVWMTMQTLSIERKQNGFFQVNQHAIHYSTGAPAPTGTALLALSKALPPGDTETSRSTRSMAMLTPSTPECDCSRQWRQHETSEVPAETQTPISKTFSS